MKNAILLNITITVLVVINLSYYALLLIWCLTIKCVKSYFF